MKFFAFRSGLIKNTPRQHLGQLQAREHLQEQDISETLWVGSRSKCPWITSSLKLVLLYTVEKRAHAALRAYKIDQDFLLKVDNCELSKPSKVLQLNAF
jgi:hypothetical protein